MVVPSPSKTKIVWPAAEADSACASVSNGAVDVPALPGSLLSTYQTQPVSAMVTRPVSVPGVPGLPSLTV